MFNIYILYLAVTYWTLPNQIHIINESKNLFLDRLIKLFNFEIKSVMYLVLILFGVNLKGNWC